MRKYTTFLPLLLVPALLAALLLAGCKAKTDAATATADPQDKVLAKVNGTPITESELSFWLQGPHGGMTSPEMKANALDKVIKAELFYQQGLKLGLDKDPQYRERIHQLEIRVEAAKRAEMMRRVYNQEIASKVTISPDEAQKYFDTHADQMGTELHLATVRFRNQADAEKALAEIKGGKSFEAVAEENLPPQMRGKKGQKGKKPWDLGMVEWKRIPTDWLTPLYSLKTGEVSGVIATPRTGVRIFKLLGRKAGPKPDFKTLQPVIQHRLREHAMQALEADYLRKLEDAAKIERFSKKS